MGPGRDEELRSKVRGLELPARKERLPRGDQSWRRLGGNGVFRSSGQSSTACFLHSLSWLAKEDARKLLLIQGRFLEFSRAFVDFRGSWTERG